MKNLYLSIIAFILAAPVLAMMSIEDVSPARAKELGIEVSTTAAGPDAARVAITFEPKGDLKQLLRVDLEMHEGGKLLLESALEQEKGDAGKVAVSFAVDRASADKFLVRIVTGQGRSMSGHVLHLKDFANALKPNAAAAEEARFLAGVQKAFESRDAAGLDALTCWDGVPDAEKQNLRKAYAALAEERGASFTFRLADPERGFVDRDQVHDGVKLRANLPITRQLECKGADPKDPKRTLFILTFGVGEKEGKLALVGWAPVK